jgi:hypothetical protein
MILSSVLIKKFKLNFVQMVEAPGYFVKVDEIPVLFELN